MWEHKQELETTPKFLIWTTSSGRCREPNRDDRLPTPLITGNTQDLQDCNARELRRTSLRHYIFAEPTGFSVTSTTSLPAISNSTPLHACSLVRRSFSRTIQGTGTPRSIIYLNIELAQNSYSCNQCFVLGCRWTTAPTERTRPDQGKNFTLDRVACFKLYFTVPSIIAVVDRFAVRISIS